MDIHWTKQKNYVHVPKRIKQSLKRLYDDMGKKMLKQLPKAPKATLYWNF